MQSKKINIIGIGMDGVLTLTKAATDAVEKADLLIGAKRMLVPFKHLGKPTICEYESEKIFKCIKESNALNIAVLMSGDCGFYSGAQKLVALSNDFKIELICGISTPIYFCSKIKTTWNDMHFFSLHGKTANIARVVSAYEKTFFLLGGNITASELCQRLCEYNLENVKVYIGENLSMDSERILRGKAADFTDLETDNLCSIIVINPHYEKNIRTGILDENFKRGNVPMTKSEVRSIVMSKLEIEKEDICWDIGCGTGSVSVEMAIQSTNGKVFAVEKNTEAVELTNENRHKFSCDNIEIIEADAVDVIDNLPVPDCVFIGGSGGKLDKIICSAYKENSDVRLVVTAISLETLNCCLTVFEKLGFDSDITQIAITRTRKIGSHTMLSAENPIFIIKRKFI